MAISTTVAVAAPQPVSSLDKLPTLTFHLHNREDGAHKETPPKQGLNQIPNQGQTDSTLTSRPTISYADALQGKVVIQDSVNEQLNSSDFDYAALKTPTLIKDCPTVLFEVTEQVSMVSKFSYALIGKFSHGKPSWKKLTEFFKQLNLKSDCKLSIFDHKHLYIICSNRTDYYRLWLKIVWNIDGFPMRVFKWEPQFNALKESSLAPVWIRFEGLPLYMFDQLPLLHLSNAIGKPICIDTRNLNGSMLNSARVCVELDVSKPLVDLIKVGFVHTGSNGLIEELLVNFFYDVVPPFCCSCWHIGHNKELCKRSIVPFDPNPNQRPGKEVAEIVLAAPMKERGRSCTRRRSRSRIKKTWVPIVATEEPLKVATKKADSSHSVMVENRSVALNDDSSHEIHLQQLPQEVIQMQQLARIDADQQATTQADAGQIAICGAAARVAQGQNIPTILEDIDSSQKGELEQIVDAPNTTMVSAQAVHAAGQLAIGWEDARRSTERPVVCAASALLATDLDGQNGASSSALIALRIDAALVVHTDKHMEMTPQIRQKEGNGEQDWQLVVRKKSKTSRGKASNVFAADCEGSLLEDCTAGQNLQSNLKQNRGQQIVHTQSEHIDMIVEQNSNNNGESKEGHKTDTKHSWAKEMEAEEDDAKAVTTIDAVLESAVHSLSVNYGQELAVVAQTDDKVLNNSSSKALVVWKGHYVDAAVVTKDVVVLPAPNDDQNAAASKACLTLVQQQNFKKGEPHSTLNSQATPFKYAVYKPKYDSGQWADEAETKDEIDDEQKLRYNGLAFKLQEGHKDIHTAEEVRYIDFEKIDVFDDIIAPRKTGSVPSSPRFKLSRRKPDLDVHEVDEYPEDWETMVWKDHYTGKSNSKLYGADDMEMETTSNSHKRYNFRARKSSRKGFKYKDFI